MRIRRLAVTLGVVVALALGVRALLPWAVARALVYACERGLGMHLEVANVDLGLFEGSAALEGVALGEPGETPLRWERVFANWAWLELPRRRIHLEALRLSGAELRLTRTADGRIEPIAGWADRGEPEAPEAPEADAPWPLRVTRFALEDARAELVDEQGTSLVALDVDAFELGELVIEDGRLRLSSVGLRGPDLRVARSLLVEERARRPEAEAGAEVEADAPAEPPYRIARLAIEDAAIAVESPAGRFEVRLDVEAEGIGEEAFPLELELGVEDGTLAYSGEVRLAPPKLSGTLRSEALPLAPFAVLVLPERAAWLRGGRAEAELELAVGSERLDASGAVTLRSLEVRDPDAEDRRLSWKSLALDALELRVPFDGAGPGVQVARLGLQGGDLRWADRSVSPPFTTHLQSVTAGAEDLRWPAMDARGVDVRGVAPDAATFVLTGDLEAGEGALRFEVDRLALAPLDSYARDVGYALDGGEGSLRTDLRLRKDELDFGNRLVIHSLAAEPVDDQGFRQEFGISFPLALALLRDPRGDIHLDVPFAVKERALRVKAAPIVRGALRQALLGALTSPLKVVGAALSRDDPDDGVSFEPLSAAPGEGELAATASERLAELAALLDARPSLGLVLAGRSGPADLELPDVAAGGLDATAPEASERLEALAAERAVRARQALVEAGVDPERLRLAEPAVAGEPGVALELFALPAPSG